MGLMDVLRKAEEQSKNAARRGRELARATLNESGRKLRRKMRVNPPAGPSAQISTEGGKSETKRQTTQERLPRTVPHGNAGPQPETIRKKIVSINGEDVRTEEVRQEELRPRGRRRA